MPLATLAAPASISKNLGTPRKGLFSWWPPRQAPLRKSKVWRAFSPEAFKAKDLFKVGRYAVGFKWGDGHASGIYTFDYLRKICPCSACAG